MASVSQRFGAEYQSPPSEWSRQPQGIEFQAMFSKSYPSPGTRFSPPQSPVPPACQQAMPAEVGQISAGIPVQLPGATPHPPSLQPQQRRYLDGQKRASFDDDHSGLVSRKQQFPDEQLSTHNIYTVKQEHSPNESSVAASGQRHKHQRASVACNRCRLVKAKCDEQMPCTNCKEKNESCNYQKPEVKRKEKVQTELLETVANISTSFADIKSSISGVDSRLSTRLANLEEEMRTIVAAIRPGAAQPTPLSMKTEPRASWDVEEPIAAFTLDDGSDIPPGSPVPAEKPAIPENHTTGTGNLLMWPPIHKLVGHLLVEHGIEIPETYPLSIEENRGLLHLYGRGEGSKSGSEVPNDFGLLASAYPKDVAPSPPYNDWGYVDTTETVSCLRSNHYHVWKLVDSYNENMQNMHPIILPQDLDALVKKFLGSLSTVCVTKSARPAPIAGFAAKHEVVGEKRKREDTDDGSGPKAVHQKRPTLSRDIQTAVVLCILALGEICLHKERIPDIVPTHGEMQGQGSFNSQPYPSQGSSASRNGVPPSPVQGTPPSVVWPPTGSRRASSGSTSEHMKRNIDVIPGLQYLANATDIMGNQMAGTSAWHVYASILAGLYYGQLSRVMESYWHIHDACIKAQHLLKDHFSRLTAANSQTQDIKDTRYYLIYWTSMQLECDIIAELNLQQSGISKYEQRMPTPNLKHMIECGIDQRVVYGYHAQIWLRKTLNKAHTALYGPKSEREGYILIDLVKILYSNLTDSEDLWWPNFHDHDPQTPADNILDARLRAKYWGAMNITCRPVIKSILMRDCQGMQEGLDMTDPLNELLDPNDKTVLALAKRGINALVHSTKAFHNLAERRYIVTNIFGTAQAQWGNLITLAAVYRNQHLSHFINPDELKDLFDKMIQFLKVVSHRSSALKVDGKILAFPTRDASDHQPKPAPQSNGLVCLPSLSLSPVHKSPIGPPLGNIHLGSYSSDREG
ncbi:hypothetical protein M0657_011385 [Pyricularia oryzae]|nr:hypothetical protein M0657_011385 [Pyricularia oryzae]